MGKKTNLKKIAVSVFLRIVALCVIVLLASYFSIIELHILKSIFNYREANDGFFWGGNLVDDLNAILFGLSFWSGVLLFSIGKKIDLLLILVINLFSFYGFFGYAHVNLEMYVGLAVAALLGNAIGFGLKVLRQKYFPKFDI